MSSKTGEIYLTKKIVYHLHMTQKYEHEFEVALVIKFLFIDVIANGKFNLKLIFLCNAT